MSEVQQPSTVPVVESAAAPAVVVVPDTPQAATPTTHTAMGSTAAETHPDPTVAPVTAPMNGATEASAPAVAPVDETANTAEATKREHEAVTHANLGYKEPGSVL